MDLLTILLVVIVTAVTAEVKVEHVELKVYQIDHNGNYEIDIYGKRYTPTPKCEKNDPYKKFRCHIHCALMGHQNGLCQTKQPLCKCEGKGNFGQKLYQDKFNAETKKSTKPTTFIDKRKENQPVTGKIETPAKEVNNKKKKTKAKPGKKVSGTHIEIMFESTEDRWADPNYSSAESKER